METNGETHSVVLFVSSVFSLQCEYVVISVMWLKFCCSWLNVYNASAVLLFMCLISAVEKAIHGSLRRHCHKSDLISGQNSDPLWVNNEKSFCFAVCKHSANWLICFLLPAVLSGFIYSLEGILKKKISQRLSWCNV